MVPGDLVHTADTFAFAAAEGISRPEDVHTWRVRENDGGADGGEWVERNGYVITTVWWSSDGDDKTGHGENGDNGDKEGSTWLHGDNERDKDGFHSLRVGYEKAKAKIY